MITWVYISEDSDNADFLQGGELVITTGMSCQSSSHWLYSFIETMIQHGTSGLVINTGKYIKKTDITNNILDLCNGADYPLFIMPWQSRINDLSRFCFDRILAERQKHSAVSSALINLITRSRDAGQSIRILEEIQFPPAAQYRICAIKSELFSDVSARLEFLLESYLSTNKHCRIFFYQNMLLFIFLNTEPDIIDQTIMQIYNLLHQSFPEESFYSGTGGSVSNLSHLSTSYTQAIAAVSMAYSHHRILYRYDDMGFFKILMAIDDSDLLNKYANEYLGTVIAYDRSHQSEYLQTLRTYLDCDRSIQDTASALFCHRNTVNYRIRILKETLHLRLDDPACRFHLMSAFQILDFLSKDNAKA